MIGPVSRARAERARPLQGLVCEDDRAIRQAILVMMIQCGFNTISFVRSARETVQAAARTHPDIVVIDAALAGASGLRIVGDLTAAAPGCDVIVLSAFETLRDRALVAGAFALCGMADRRDLQRCLEHALAHRAAEIDACDCERFADAGGLSGPTSRVSTQRGAL